MVGQSPSIQSFFPLQSSPLITSPRTSSPAPGDGFTPEELDTSLVPARKDDWTPPANYDEYDIDSLVPGPNRVKVVGRIVNLFESSPKAKLPNAAKGSVHLVVKDNTNAVTVSVLSFCLHKLVLRAVWRSNCLIYASRTACESANLSRSGLLISEMEIEASFLVLLHLCTSKSFQRGTRVAIFLCWMIRSSPNSAGSH